MQYVTEIAIFSSDDALTGDDLNCLGNHGYSVVVDSVKGTQLPADALDLNVTCGGKFLYVVYRTEPGVAKAIAAVSTAAKNETHNIDWKLAYKITRDSNNLIQHGPANLKEGTGSQTPNLFLALTWHQYSRVNSVYLSDVTGLATSDKGRSSAQTDVTANATDVEQKLEARSYKCVEGHFDSPVRKRIDFAEGCGSGSDYIRLFTLSEVVPATTPELATADRLR